MTISHQIEAHGWIAYQSMTGEILGVGVTAINALIDAKMAYGEDLTGVVAIPASGDLMNNIDSPWCIVDGVAGVDADEVAASV